MKVDIYLSHAPEDGELAQGLQKHLASLERHRLVSVTTSEVDAGAMKLDVLDARLDAAHIIILLLSVAFSGSERCLTEMNRALERHSAGNTHVVPVLVRPYDHALEPFVHLHILPEPQRPVSSFQHQDEAWEVVTRAVRCMVERLERGEPLAALSGRGLNPFEYGTPVPPDRFAGRRAQRSDVKARIGGVSAQSVSIVGLHRSGKSSLLRYIQERIHEFCAPKQRPLQVLLDLQAQRFHTPEGIVEGIRRGIERVTHEAPWRPTDNRDDYAIEDGLVALRDQGFRLLVVIDELERIAARLDQFQVWGEDMRAKASAGHLSLVISTRRPLPDVYSHCGLTSPFGNIFSQVTLGALSASEWDLLVRNGYARAGAAPRGEDMKLIEELGGYLPFYTQMAAWLLWQHADHDTTRREFRVQAADRFRELWRGLSPSEQNALRAASGMPGLPAPPADVMENLERLGLLRPSGEVFSSAFSTFVREQR